MGTVVEDAVCTSKWTGHAGSSQTRKTSDPIQIANTPLGHRKFFCSREVADVRYTKSR